MKNIFILIIVVMLAACGGDRAEKPKDLIEEQKMVAIFYDLALLEAIKSQKPMSLRINHINPTNYIYKKYKIDSLQFVRSNKYYASDLENYKKMYEAVSKKIENEKVSVDSIIAKRGIKPQPIDPDEPRVE